MNTLQKSLISFVTIVSFGAYAYFLRTQESLIVTAPVAETSPDTEAPVADTASSSAELQAYIDQINASAASAPKTQPSHPIITGGDDEESDREDEGDTQTLAQQQYQAQVAAQQKAAARALAQQQADARAQVQAQAQVQTANNLGNTKTVRTQGQA